MDKNVNDFSNKLYESRESAGIGWAVTCSHDDQKKYIEMVKNGEQLPVGVFYIENVHYENGKLFRKYFPQDIEAAEVLEMYENKQLNSLKAIEKYLRFFFALACVGIGVFIIYLLILLFRAGGW